MFISDSTEVALSEFTCAEYFAGIGLVRLGLEKAGWEIVFANDWDQAKYDTYSAYFEGAGEHYQVQDIFSLCHWKIPRTLLATASFPCVDLSLAGNLEGINGRHSSAFWGFTAILSTQSPKPYMVMIENVPGWLSSNGGKDFRSTIQELSSLGYACDVYAINASHFVPQSRLRIFVVGIYRDCVNKDMFAFENRDPSLRTKALDKAISDNFDLPWHFLDVPPLPVKTNAGLGLLVENLSEDDERWWTEYEVERHLDMMSAINLKYIQGHLHLSDYSYTPMYRRVRAGKQQAELRKDGIAGCLRTAKGGSSRQMLVRAGKGRLRMRLMTPREYARLQGVPDDYPIPIKVNQALTGFGDAVCVPVITWLASNVLNPMAKSLIEKTLVLQR